MSLIALLLELKEQRIFVNKNQEKLSIKADKGLMTDDIKQQLAANKAAILASFEQLNIASNQQIAPLTFGQRGLWYIDQLGEGSREYNQLNFIQLQGELNLPVIEQAYNRILQRHDILRTVYVEEAGEPYQIVRDWQPQSVTTVDLSGLAPNQQKQELQRLADEQAMTEFDLTRDLMLQVTIFQLSDEQAVMAYCLHHIASDGWSLTLLENEFIQLFNRLRQGQLDNLPDLSVQYADYAHWQKQFSETDAYQQTVDYWLKQLANLPPVHKVPLDFPRPEKLQRQGAQHVVTLNASLTAQLQQMCEQQNVTLFMALYSLLSLMMSRYSGETDIVIGTPIANREQSGIQALIGYFVNSLVLRVDVAQSQDFNALLQSSRHCILDAYQYHQMPFDELVNKLGVERSASYDPVFQIMLVLQNNARAEGQLEHVQSSDSQALTLPAESQTALFDLNLTVTETSAGLELVWDYNTSLFKPQTVARMADSFVALTQSAMQQLDAPLASLTLLNDDQVKQILDFNPPVLPDSEYQTSACYFEAISTQHPEQLAVIYQDQTLTYRELNEYSNRFARYLQQGGLQMGDTVALLLPRGIELIVSIWALHKLGVAYLAIDSDYPAPRQLFMLEDSEAAGIICWQLPEDYAEFQGYKFALNHIVEQQLLDAYSASNIEITPEHSKQIAYIVYTSGSTGQPKGIAVSHQNLLTNVEAAQSHYAMTTNDRMLQFSSISFDIFADELFASMYAGATMVIRDEQINQSSALFWQFVHRHQVTVVHLPTAFWHLLVADIDQLHAPETLPCRLITAGGEKMSAAMLQRWQQAMPDSIQVLNIYGPSETTISTTIFDVTHFQPEGEDIPIGVPMNNYQVLIMASDGQLAPIGVNGEMYIGGEAVVAGYLNRDELNRNSFVDHPLGLDDSKWFRTGDFARFNEQGLIIFSGRKDNQLKFHSFRVEPSEIEYQLSQLPMLSLAVVDVVTHEGNKQLVAFVQPQTPVLTSEQGRWVQDVKRELRKQLPAYLIPSLFVLVEKMPMTVNGKVDNANLPGLDTAIVGGDYKPPNTETEHKLLAIWADLLQVSADKISITAHFFELGGHSLLVVKMLSAITETFAVSISLPTFYEDPCIEGAATLIDVELAQSTLDSDQAEAYSEEMEW